MIPSAIPNRFGMSTGSVIDNLVLLGGPSGLHGVGEMCIDHVARLGPPSMASELPLGSMESDACTPETYGSHGACQRGN